MADALDVLATYAITHLNGYLADVGIYTMLCVYIHRTNTHINTYHPIHTYTENAST